MKYRGAKISFIPFEVTVDDPKGERGYCTYKLMYEGKQYGQALLLKKSTGTAGAEAWAKGQIDRLLADLKAGKMFTDA